MGQEGAAGRLDRLQGPYPQFHPAVPEGPGGTPFRDRAYDQVAFQLADSANQHTNDPERFRGTIVDMRAEPDGLWIYLDPTERGEQVLRENPNLGVSARIVEQYARADGKFYPAAVQHVLGTLDPRVTGLGTWQPVDMANSNEVVIDLSGSSFPGEPGPPRLRRPVDQLLDGLDEQEQLDALQALTEAEADALYAGTATAISSPTPNWTRWWRRPRLTATTTRPPGWRMILTRRSPSTRLASRPASRLSWAAPAPRSS